ncbi:MAG: hypothetical protein FD165_949 [Gammaproteobacteria bacterium]|nr:MAG: hypothetical protein FD165_949 [Gammaproteobacteria bacterium]TND06342.1 MAG: hypothetical protein FD120_829 [Gammaproteobacteria bacterium]
MLTTPGVDFIDLQYGDSRAEIAAVCTQGNMAVHTWDDADPLHDLDDFAAQVAALDRVISVNNTTVHVAGALGVPVWVMLPLNSEWRWLRDRADSPWYPSLQLFRQSTLGDWSPVFAAVAARLAGGV